MKPQSFRLVNYQQSAPTQGAFSRVTKQACGRASGYGMD